MGSSSANNLLLTVDKTSSPSPTQIHGTLGIASNGKLTYSLNAPKKGTNGIGYLLASGPTVSGKYSYVIVADMDKKKVVVLARDVQTFRSKYVNEVKKKLKELGYNDGVKLLSYCGL